MITNILPITEKKIKILIELYKYSELNLASLSKNLQLPNSLVLRTIHEISMLLECKVMGRIKLYSIKKEYISTLIPIIERIRLERTFKENITIFQLINNNLQIECMYVYGSYAKEKQTENSDIDLCVIISEDKKKVIEYVKKLGQLTRLNFELNIFSPLEFEKLKMDKNSNMHHIIFTHNYERIKVY